MFISLNGGKKVKVIAKVRNKNQNRNAYCISSEDTKGFRNLYIGKCNSNILNDDWEILYGELPTFCHNLDWIAGHAQIKETMSEVSLNEDYLFGDI